MRKPRNTPGLLILNCAPKSGTLVRFLDTCVIFNDKTNIYSIIIYYFCVQTHSLTFLLQVIHTIVITTRMLRKAKMTSDDILKLKAVTLYVTSKFSDIGFHKLFKILYFADQLHCAEYGRRIISDKFCSFPDGPVPSNLRNAISITKGERGRDEDPLLIPISESITIVDKGGKCHFLKAIEKPDMDELSKSDIECLDWSINKNRNRSFKQLKELSHDLAWQEGSLNLPNKIMDPVTMAKAIGANDDMLRYISDKEVIKAYLA